MKKSGMVFLAIIVTFGTFVSGANAQKTVGTDYKAQLEAALGGKILAVQKTTRYPASSLTQVLNFTVDRGGGRTGIVPVEVVSVKVGDSYAVKSMFVIGTSTTMAIQRTTQLPVPEPGTGGSGGGGSTGTNPPAPSRAQQCWDKCYKALSGLIDFAQLEVCFFACMLGLPIIPK